MVERLFFDGIDLQGSRGSVAYTVEFSSLIDANETETGLAFPDVAMPRAEIAVHAAFGHGLPPAAFVECFRLLQYFLFLHCDSRRGIFSSSFFPQAPRGACTHSSNPQLYTLLDGIPRRVHFGIMGCFHVTEFHVWRAALPPALPSSGRAGQAQWATLFRPSWTRSNTV